MSGAFPNGLREPGAELALANKLPGAIAFLRHRVAGVEHRESSDWDLAVRDPKVAGRVVEEMFGQPLVIVPKRFVIQRYFSWGQIDLLPAFEWQGICYLDPQRFWNKIMVGRDGLPRPCVAHDAFIVWMTGLLWGRRYAERYDELIARAFREQESELRACLVDAFGSRRGVKMLELARTGLPGKAVAWVPALRLALWRQGLARDGLETVARQARHWKTEVDHHLRPPYPWIAILGPDGSGKSAVIGGLLERVQPTRLRVMESHWWPEPRKEGEKPGPPVVDPHGQALRGNLLSIGKTAWLCLRWWKSAAGNVGHARSKRALLLSDRYFDDLLVDPRRYRYGADVRWARFMFRFLPRPDRVILLLGDADVIHARKQEVSLAEMQRQMAGYRELAAELGPRAVVIDATQPLSQVIDQVWQATLGAASAR